MSEAAPTKCLMCGHDRAAEQQAALKAAFVRPPLQVLAEKWFERFKGAHFVNVRVRKSGDWTEYEGDDIATAIRDAAKEYQ